MLLLYRARCNYELGNVQGAQADLEQILQIDPTNSEALTIRGLQRLDSGALNEALQDFSRALSSDPYKVDALLARSYCFVLLRRFHDALADSEHAWDLDPSNQTAKSNASGCCIYEGQAALSQPISDLYIWPNIPEHTLSNAKTSCILPHCISPEPRVLLLYDDTFSGGAGYGLCMCEDAVYWKTYLNERCYFKQYAHIQTVAAHDAKLEIDGVIIVNNAFGKESTMAYLSGLLLRLKELHRRHIHATTVSL
jgi:tetratricopeptide (TPR) repeat protein